LYRTSTEKKTVVQFGAPPPYMGKILDKTPEHIEHILGKTPLGVRFWNKNQFVHQSEWEQVRQEFQTGTPEYLIGFNAVDGSLRHYYANYLKMKVSLPPVYNDIVSAMLQNMPQLVVQPQPLWGDPRAKTRMCSFGTDCSFQLPAPCRKVHDGKGQGKGKYDACSHHFRRRGGCTKGDNCMFAHDVEQVRCFLGSDCPFQIGRKVKQICIDAHREDMRHFQPETRAVLNVKFSGAGNQPSDNLYITGLPSPQVEQATLNNFFSRLQLTVVRSRIIPDTRGLGSCTAMVQLQSVEAAQAAIDVLHGQHIDG